MNPTQSIEIFDMPRRLCAGFISLPTGKPDPSIDNGNIISEVGEGILINKPYYRGPFLSYMLRKFRKYKVPKHVFGKMFLGDAWSALTPRIIPVPAVGTVAILPPKLTWEQGDFIRYFRFIQADVTWIVHCPSPLGVGLLLELYAPEIDSRTKTRGLRFRPAGTNTVSVTCPWSNDLSVVDRTIGRVGQSGGSLAIRVVEDNTIEAVSTPLNLTIYCVVSNVICTGKIPAPQETVEIVGLNFISAEPVTFEDVLTYHGDVEHTSTEVNAEGAASISDQVLESATVPAEIAVETETQMAEPVPTIDARKTKNQQRNAGTRWFEADPITVDSTQLGVWQNLTVNPYRLGNRGDNISRAYKRNVWTSGPNMIGYITTLIAKFVITRSPQISGLIEVQDSRNDSSRYLVEFGGNVEIPLCPKNFSSATTMARPRYSNNHFLRTDEAQCDFRFRLVGFNRTSDIADVKLRLLLRAGFAYFDVSTKPRPQVSVLDWLVDELNLWVESKDLLMLEEQVLYPHGDEEITAKAGNLRYKGEVHEFASVDEDLDQDDYQVQVWSGNLPVGSIVTVPLNLALAEDLSGSGGMSTIAEKFERNAHIIPSGPGNLGANIASYTIETRLPTNLTGQISHVSLPGDMTDFTAAFAFGLGDILSIATSALQAVGGPTVSAGIAAGRAIFNMVKGVLGKDPKESNSEAQNQPSLSGPLDISRFVNFLKPILQNEALDPIMPNILMQARDFIGQDGNPLTSIPARIWATMKNVGVERSLFDRFITPSTTMVQEIIIPYDRYAFLVDLFGSHPKTFIKGTHQNTCWMKYMTTLRNRGARQTVTSLTLSEILACEVTPQEEEYLDNLLITRSFTFLP